MRRFRCVLCSATLAACATNHTTNHNAMETAEISAAAICSEIPFTAVPQCVRSQFNLRYPDWRSDANADLVNIFLAWSEAAAARVQEGTLSEEEARQRGLALQTRLDRIATERQVNAQINSQAAAELMLAGAALISAGQSQPVMTSPMAAPVPSRSPTATAPYLQMPSPVVPSAPLQAPVRYTQSPIICSVNGDAQLAIAVCH